MFISDALAPHKIFLSNFPLSLLKNSQPKDTNSLLICRIESSCQLWTIERSLSAGCVFRAQTLWGSNVLYSYMNMYESSAYSNPHERNWVVYKLKAINSRIYVHLIRRFRGPPKFEFLAFIRKRQKSLIRNFTGTFTR